MNKIIVTLLNALVFVTNINGVDASSEKNSPKNIVEASLDYMINNHDDSLIETLGKTETYSKPASFFHKAASFNIGPMNSVSDDALKKAKIEVEASTAWKRSGYYLRAMTYLGISTGFIIGTPALGAMCGLASYWYASNQCKRADKIYNFVEEQYNKRFLRQ